MSRPSVQPPCILFPLLYSLASVLLDVCQLSTVNIGEEKVSHAGRFLIAHVDDAGMSHFVNRDTTSVLETKAANFASTMALYARFTQFPEHAKIHPKFDYRGNSP